MVRDGVFSIESPNWQKFYVTEAYERSQMCETDAITEIDFCDWRRENGECCNLFHPGTGTCCDDLNEDTIDLDQCQLIGEVNLPYRYARWTQIIDFHGDYHFSLRNLSEQLIPYRLRVTTTQPQ